MRVRVRVCRLRFIPRPSARFRRPGRSKQATNPQARCPWLRRNGMSLLSSESAAHRSADLVTQPRPSPVKAAVGQVVRITQHLQTAGKKSRPRARAELSLDDAGINQPLASALTSTVFECQPSEQADPKASSLPRSLPARDGSGQQRHRAVTKVQCMCISGSVLWLRPRHIHLWRLSAGRTRREEGKSLPTRSATHRN